MNFDRMMGYFAALHYMAYSGLDAGDPEDIKYTYRMLAKKQGLEVSDRPLDAALSEFYLIQDEVESNLNDA